MQIGLGLSKHRDPLSAANEALWQAKAAIGTDKISLAFVFSSAELASPALLKTFQVYLPRIPIIGCSSLAVIHNSNIHKHSLMILLISTKELQISVASVKNIREKSAFVAGQELAKNLLERFWSPKRDLAMIFCDGLIEEGSKLILGIQQILGSSFPIAGASASDNLRFYKTYLYYNNEMLTDAAVGILWGGKLNFGLSLRHGWKPLGKPRTITESKGNIIKEIDNQKAVKLYQDYFAKDVLNLKKELKYISTLYPIGLYLEGEQEYLLRNIISINEDGSLICQGDVPSGSRARLMIGTEESCLDAAQEAAHEAKENFNLLIPPFAKTKPSIKFVFVFNSVSRYILLRRKANEELNMIHKAIGIELPLIGIYTYGEQGPLKATAYQGKVHFHNQTIVIIALGG